ncbi:MlaD family protein [Methylomicrobium sp. RS1]|jgi:paraquat-inducible protein B|uniref:MlaD family protein n=1 Tax=Candidatus Methylomicrobium oryzae TaxID=2802053 RepID=UPI001922F094|nr:MlaD family protein [Methylomicrobium sp. RS1]MBL1265280.1 MCE family protein [Methylomicrobium sp. RS1]
MSKPINPMAIGGFTVGALALLIVGVLMFGGGQFFNADKSRFVVYFDTSLNGLDAGAPVKMQGVKIGEVTEISIELDPKTIKTYKPVVVEIDRNSLTGVGGVKFPRAMTRAQQVINRDNLVKAGFRARLETQSLLTGLLYVDIDVYRDKPPVFVGLDYKGLVEFPSIPKTTDELRNTAEEVAKKLRSLPLDQIVMDFAESVKELKNLLASEDVKKSRQALTKTLEGMEKTVTTLNKNLEPLLKDTNQAIQNTNLFMQDSRAMVRDVHQDIRPILATTDKTLLAATAALNRTQESMANVSEAIGPDSALNETLESLKEASRSIKELTDYLERHPESLISGKDH